uniref:Uncharacterized protein n=1 Tax=Anguilla anguilla TaxID=7936 RepID=A0A0E9WY39_ANGAN
MNANHFSSYVIMNAKIIQQSKIVIHRSIVYTLLQNTLLQWYQTKVRLARYQV